MTKRSIAVLSVFMDNIPLSIAHFQARVVEHFFSGRVDHFQVLSNLPHGQQIDRLLAGLNYENYLILDIDAVPLCTDVLDWLFAPGEKIRGHMQRSNHLGAEELFVGPSFMAFTRDVYEATGRPSFQPTSRHDVGEFFCRTAEESGINLEFLRPVHVTGELKWALSSAHKEAGVGTSFGLNGKLMSFHNFEIRKQENQRIFVQKCLGILGESRIGYYDPILNAGRLARVWQRLKNRSGWHR